MAVKAIIFDYKTLLAAQGTDTASQARELLEWARSQGLRWCLFSTDPLTSSQQTMFTGTGYPSPDEHVRKADIPSGKNRGRRTGLM